MFSVSRSAIVNYTCQQMFDLVNDVDSYSRFMKGCVASTVLSRSDQELTARLTLGYKGIQHSFVTKNTLLHYDSIKMELLEGPFSHFNGAWYFTPVNDSPSENDKRSKMSLELGFDFSNPLLKLTVGRLVEGIANLQVECVHNEAQQRYKQQLT